MLPQLKSGRATLGVLPGPEEESSSADRAIGAVALARQELTHAEHMS